ALGPCAARLRCVSCLAPDAAKRVSRHLCLRPADRDGGHRARPCRHWLTGYAPVGLATTSVPRPRQIGYMSLEAKRAAKSIARQNGRRTARQRAVCFQPSGGGESTWTRSARVRPV